MPGEKAALLHSREAGQATSCWLFDDLTPAANCVATLAVAGHPYRLMCWQLPALQEYIDTYLLKE